MTEFQQKHILKMRAEGKGYLAIANIVGVSRDTVRNFCKNKNMQGYGAITALNIKERVAKGDLCTNCHIPITKKHTGRQRKFCSDKC